MKAIKPDRFCGIILPLGLIGRDRMKEDVLKIEQEKKEERESQDLGKEIIEVNVIDKIEYL